MTESILTLNAGSSSLKFAWFASDAAVPTARGAVETLNEAPHLVARDAKGGVLAEQSWPAGLPDAFDTVLNALMRFAEEHIGEGGLGAVGHRVVHGGANHVAPELVTPDLLKTLDAVIALDPLHLPHNIGPMRAVAAARPGLRQVACYDTAFHHDLPAVAQRIPLPAAVIGTEMRRYGFHGLSYEYIASRLKQISPRLAAGRVIVAHLGSGASLCALQNGRSIETTMGFSALDGLVMATRCGSLDPGVLLYLGQRGHSFSDIEDMLYKRSGLLGVSGISGDVRALQKSADPLAAAALDLFSYRLAAHVGALTSALNGLDGLVFTAGIGEHAAFVRAAVCARLSWLGLLLDQDANEAGAAVISKGGSTVEIRIIPTDEEAVIARHTRAVLKDHPP